MDEPEIDAVADLGSLLARMQANHDRIQADHDRNGRLIAAAVRLYTNQHTRYTSTASQTELSVSAAVSRNISETANPVHPSSMDDHNGNIQIPTHATPQNGNEAKKIDEAEPPVVADTAIPDSNDLDGQQPPDSVSKEATDAALRPSETGVQARKKKRSKSSSSTSTEENLHHNIAGNDNGTPTGSGGTAVLDVGAEVHESGVEDMDLGMAPTTASAPPIQPQPSGGVEINESEKQTPHVAAPPDEANNDCSETHTIEQTPNKSQLNPSQKRPNHPTNSDTESSSDEEVQKTSSAKRRAKKQKLVRQTRQNDQHNVSRETSPDALAGESGTHAKEMPSQPPAESDFAHPSQDSKPVSKNSGEIQSPGPLIQPKATQTVPAAHTVEKPSSSVSQTQKPVPIGQPAAEGSGTVQPPVPLSKKKPAGLGRRPRTRSVSRDREETSRAAGNGIKHPPTKQKKTLPAIAETPSKMPGTPEVPARRPGKKANAEAAAEGKARGEEDGRAAPRQQSGRDASTKPATLLSRKRCSHSHAVLLCVYQLIDTSAMCKALPKYELGAPTGIKATDHSDSQIVAKVDKYRREQINITTEFLLVMNAMRKAVKGDPLVLQCCLQKFVPQSDLDGDPALWLKALFDTMAKDLKAKGKDALVDELFQQRNQYDSDCLRCTMHTTRLLSSWYLEINTCFTEIVDKGTGSSPSEVETLGTLMQDKMEAPVKCRRACATEGCGTSTASRQWNGIEPDQCPPNIILRFIRATDRKGKPLLAYQVKLPPRFNFGKYLHGRKRVLYFELAGVIFHRGKSISSGSSYACHLVDGVWWDMRRAPRRISFEDILENKDQVHMAFYRREGQSTIHVHTKALPTSTKGGEPKPGDRDRDPDPSSDKRGKKRKRPDDGQNGGNGDEGGRKNAPPPSKARKRGNGDVKDNPSRPEPRGLMNRGLMCFGDAAIQLLSHVTESKDVAEHLPAARNHRSDLWGKGKRQIIQLTNKLKSNHICPNAKLTNLLRRMQEPGDAEDDPFPFQKAFILATGRQEYDRKQQDSALFLSDVLAHCDDVAQKSKDNWFRNQFGVIEQKRITCSKCHVHKVNDDRGWLLTLEPHLKDRKVVGSTDFDKLLDKKKKDTRKESLKCNRCKGQCTMEWLGIRDAPKSLMIKYQRAGFDKRSDFKLQYDPDLPKNLDLSPYVQGTDGEKRKAQYRLKSVVLHIGSSLRSGHYVACTRTDNGTWYLLDDAHVRKADEEEILDGDLGDIYYAAYEQVEDED